MGLSVNFDCLKNQNVKFTAKDADCSDVELVYNNIVNATDITQVQFELNPAYYADNLIQNGDLNSTGGFTLTNMTHNSLLDVVTNDGDTYSAISIIPNAIRMPMGLNTYVKLDITIFTNTHGVEILLGTENYSLVAGQIGTFTFYGIMGDDTASNNLIRLSSPAGTNKSFTVSSIYATPIEYNYVFLIRNLGTGLVENYYKLWQYFSYVYNNGTGGFRIYENKVTWSIDWGDLGLTEGCYQLEVCDPSINFNLQNGLPNFDFNYLEENNLDYNGGNVVATFDGDSAISLTHFAGIIGIFQIVTTVAPETGISFSYSVNFTNVDLSGGGITLTIGFAGDQDAHVITGASTVTGTVVSDGGVFTFAIAMSSNASCDITIANVYPTSEQSYVGDWISNGLKLTDGDCNTVVLHGCSDTDNSLGFNFGSSDFDLRGRLEGKFTSANYSFDRESIEYGRNANNRNIYFKRKKTKVLKLNLLPEYSLDFLSTLVGLDHIYVDNVEYEATGDEFFSISYPDGINTMAYATLFLTERDTTIERSATVEMGLGCSDTIECVIDPETDECLVDPQSNDPVLMP